MFARIKREEQSELGADETEFFVNMILFEPPDNVTVWQVANHQSPRSTSVSAFDKVWLKVAALVVVQRCIDCIIVV